MNCPDCDDIGRPRSQCTEGEQSLSDDELALYECQKDLAACKKVLQSYHRRGIALQDEIDALKMEIKGLKK